MNIEINIFTVLEKNLNMCQRGNAHLATLKSKSIEVDSLPKDIAERKQEWQTSPALQKHKKLPMPTFTYRSSS
jgi:hypothetical protein